MKSLMNKGVKKLFVVAMIFSVACSADPEMEKGVDGLRKKDVAENTVASMEDSWDETIGDPIAVNDADRWMTRFRDKNPNTTLSHYFGKDSFDRIFKNQSVVGVSINYAIDDSHRPQLILIGIDRVGNQLTKYSFEEGDSYEDASRPCPPLCPN